MKTSFKLALSSLFALSLAACAGQSALPPPCPSILIPKDGAKLTRFKPGPGRDIIDVLHEESMTGFASACEYNIDETGTGDLTVWVAPTIKSNTGAANIQKKAAFEYFIAVIDDQKKVWDKQNFKVEISFEQNMNQVLWQTKNPNSIMIPLKAGESGDKYSIYIGLQPTRDELLYQRNQH